MLGTQKLPGGTVWRIVEWTDTLVGVAETALLPPPDTAWIALLLIRREFQGQGYGSEAASLLETHLFSHPGIKQIGLAILMQNIPAIAFWEKRGYVRGAQCLDNEGHNVYEYHLSHPMSATEMTHLVV